MFASTRVGGSALLEFLYARDAMALPPYTSLAERWLRDAVQEASTDQQLIQLIDRCRTGSSVNEPALLHALVAYAETISAATGTKSGSGGETTP